MTMLSNRIKINKIITTKDGTIIKLKDSINGMYENVGSGIIFYSTHPRFSCEISKKELSKIEINKEIQEFIYANYKKTVKNRLNATLDELAIFNFINTVNTKPKEGNKKILVLGYKGNYSTAICNNIMALDDKINYKLLEMNKNVDLHVGEDYHETLVYIMSNIERFKPDYFILDLNNMYLYDYKITKDIIKYVEDANKKILFLVQDFDHTESIFTRIFGEKYRNCCVDRMGFIYAINTRLFEKAKNILFE